MVVLNFNHTSYKAYLKGLALSFGIPYNNEDYLQFTDPIGKGIVRSVSLYDELEVLLVDVTFRDSLMIKREKSDSRHFILHFDDVDIDSTVKFSVEEDSLSKSNVRHSFARLTSNIFTNTEMIPPNFTIRSVKILFNEKWLKKYMELDSNTSLVQRYLMLKTESFDLEKLDAEYLKLMHELLNYDPENPLLQIYLQNRVSLLLERFFRNLHKKTNMLKGKFKLSEDEILRVIEVEKNLVDNFVNPLPSINEFSRLAIMSQTKLKKSFKEMYGDSIYAYYQKRRMNKAKELLSSGKFNVKQTADAIGYNNTSNFILAFKKMFKKLPGGILVL